MPQIEVLDEQTIDKIAAGEVVGGHLLLLRAGGECY